MPRASIKLDFKSDELRKFVEDAARRWTLNAIHDVLKHVRDPEIMRFVREAVRTGMDVGRQQRRPQPAEYGDDFVDGPPPGWVQAPAPPPGFVEELLSRRRAPRAAVPKPEKLERCAPVEANLYQEEGWACHECGIYNGASRGVCRQCAHERCDDAAPPNDGDPN